MRKLYYSSGQMFIGDRTCKALLRYARALAVVGKSDVVSIPIINEGGARALAHLIIGPASQLFSTPVEHATDDPDDPEIIAELEAQTLINEPSRPAWPLEMEDVPSLEDLMASGDL